MGFPDERVNELTDSVAECAQLGEYLDFPMRKYSTGMSTRLGFALATHLDPEVLLVDEPLAGDDSKLQERVAQKLHELCSSGRTVVVVTPAMRQLKMMASSCLWPHQGKVIDYGEPDEVIRQYLRFCRLDASSEGLDDD